jgi:YD repeat-containing protein
VKNHRVNDNAFDLFVSSDNLIYTPVPRGDWDYAKDTGDGEISITFKQATAIRYLKIHFKHDDRDPLFLPADKATFLNELAKTVQVYQEATSQTEEYQYDAAGNRTLVKMTLAHTDLYLSEYYPNSDRLKTDGKHTYTYDNAGNMITKSGSDESWAYRYDFLNRLIEVKKNDTIIVNYKYDPSGLRVVREKPIGAKTHYVFEGTEVIFEKNISTGNIKSYVYAFGKHLARVDGKIGDTAAKKYFYHTDNLGSVKTVTDKDGKVVYKADFQAFGGKLLTVKNLPPVEGEKVIKHTANGNDSQTMSYDANNVSYITASSEKVAVSPGCTMSFSVWAKGNKGGENIQLFIFEYDADGGVFTKASAKSYTVTKDWVKYTFTYTLSATAKWAWCRLDNDIAGNIVYWCDPQLVYAGQNYLNFINESVPN